MDQEKLEVYLKLLAAKVDLALLLLKTDDEEGCRKEVNSLYPLVNKASANAQR